MHNYPLEFYVSRLNDKRPFSFSRFGDGEWHCILGKKGENCNGDTYTSALAHDLRQCFTQLPEENYFRGHLTIAHHAGREKVARFQKILADNWVNGDVFLNAFLAREIRPLVEAFPERFLYVGPEYLRPLFGRKLLVIPAKNCHAQIDDLVKRVDAEIGKKHIDMVGFSAGMCANVLIHRLYPDHGNQVTMIDFGSLWDGCLGVPSRSYVEGLDPEKMRLATFGESVS